jgi:hypothetical protein
MVPGAILPNVDKRSNCFHLPWYMSNDKHTSSILYNTLTSLNPLYFDKLEGFVCHLNIPKGRWMQIF